MKVIFVVISITMMCQVSFAGVVGRFRRDSLTEDLDSSPNTIKIVAQATGPLVTSILKEIPKTNAYAPFKQELEDFLESYNEYKTKPGVCFTKSVELFKKFMTIIENYQARDPTAEDKKLDELFDSFQSNGLEEELEHFNSIIEDVDSNEVFDVDYSKHTSKMMEVC